MSHLRFVALMLADFVGAKGTTAKPALIGAVILAGVLLALIWAVRRMIRDGVAGTRVPITVAVLSGYVLLFCANTSAGRICLGMQAAQQSRYMTYLIVGFLAVYFAATALPRAMLRSAARYLLLLVFAWSSLHIHPWDLGTARNVALDRSAWRECYLQVESIEQCDLKTGVPVYPNATATNLQQKLTFLKQHRLNLYATGK